MTTVALTLGLSSWALRLIAELLEMVVREPYLTGFAVILAGPAYLLTRRARSGRLAVLRASAVPQKAPAKL